MHKTIVFKSHHLFFFVPLQSKALLLASGEIIVLGCENSKALTTELTSIINNSEG